MLSILRGGLISVTGGAWITNLPAGYDIAHWSVGGLIPMPVFLMVTADRGRGATGCATRRLGRSIYAAGGNAEAARLVGISPQRTIVTVFAIHGLFVGIAAVLFATQLSVIQSTVPPNLELTIITASVVGGVSILGGIGTVVGSSLGRRADRGDRVESDLRGHLALLAARRAGSADPGDRTGRHRAAPAARA